MRILFVALVLMTAVSAEVFSQTKFSTYKNERFAYSIDYPSNLKMQPPPENGDGRKFVSKDGSVEMLVWGNYNAGDEMWREQYESDLKYFGEKPTYTVLRADWYVISGMKEGKVFYQKVLQRTLHQKLGNFDVFYTFTIEYPRSESKLFDPIVKRIASSFRFDPTADV
jgi:hypothetical protein